MLIWSININILSLSNMVSPNWEVKRVKDFCPILFASIEANRGKIFARNTS